MATMRELMMETLRSHGIRTEVLEGQLGPAELTDDELGEACDYLGESVSAGRIEG